VLHAQFWKALIFLMLCSANLHDHAVFAKNVLKVNYITERFLADLVEIIVNLLEWPERQETSSID